MTFLPFEIMLRVAPLVTIDSSLIDFFCLFSFSKTIYKGPLMEKKSIENWIYNHRKEFTDPDRQKQVNPGKKPRVKNIVFHGLRHSYNQNREKRMEGDPRKRQKLSQGLGHRRLAVNDIYRE